MDNFTKVLKFNPNHDKAGRFTTGSGGSSVPMSAEERAWSREGARQSMRGVAAGEGLMRMSSAKNTELHGGLVTEAQRSKIVGHLESNGFKIRTMVPDGKGSTVATFRRESDAADAQVSWSSHTTEAGTSVTEVRMFYGDGNGSNRHFNPKEKNTLGAIDKLTQNNMHTKAMAKAAELLGDKDMAKALRAIETKHKELGSLSPALSDQRFKLYTQLKDKAKSTLTESSYNDFLSVM